MVAKSGTDLRSSYWLYKLLPAKAIAYAQLARLDRPIGWQLLFWPCLWGVLLAFYAQNLTFGAKVLPNLTQLNFLPIALAHYYQLPSFVYFVWLAFLLLVGSIAMRGAGCTYNDIVDHKIDAKVARTATRPIPSNRVSRKNAKIFMLLQCLVGLVVLLQLPIFTIILGLCSLFIVAIYPFMKRISNWPQAVLGLCFNWGVLVGFSAVSNGLSIAAIVLYFAAIFWTIGYDTIYAHQDREDDALIGAYSTARLFGEKSRIALIILYGITAAGLIISYYLVNAGMLAFVGVGLAIIALIWQIYRFDMDDGARCLRLFKSNNWIGILITVFTGLCLV